MGSISIRQLALALCGKNFAELVTYQLNSLSYTQLRSAIDGAKSCLPLQVQFELEEIIHNIDEVTSDHRFWSNDCGLVLRFITTMTKKHLSRRYIHTSEKELIELFHLIVMHCAYRASKNPQMLSFLKKTGIGGLHHRQHSSSPGVNHSLHV